VKQALVFVSLVVVLATPAAAAVTEREALERFYTQELQPEWFAPDFLDQVPFEQLAPVRDRIAGDLGVFVEVRRDGDRWMAVFEEGRVPTHVALDAEGRFTTLFLRPPVPDAADLDAVAERFDALPGDGHLLVRVDGEARLAVDADEPFAVGSAFKLVVLRALVDAIERGDRSWSDVVTYEDVDRGLATGTLGRWPVGSPLTLHTAATLMISQSDNEATDLLIRELGRAAVEAADPSQRNLPFLTTVEAFKLKDPDNAPLLERWRSGDERARRDLLGELPLVMELPRPSLFTGDPVATDVEWFLTATELCDLIAGLSDLDLMGVNPGVVDAANHERVAYKGGSEPGVLNMTTWVRDDEGREICVCATRNADEPIETTDLSGVVSAAFDVLDR
jgi:beta-lactamase class A